MLFQWRGALQVHKLCQVSANQILNEFKPNLMIAIGGGGYVPARILRYAYARVLNPNASADGTAPESRDVNRSFLKTPNSPNIPIQAIGLSLYENLGQTGDSDIEQAGTKVTRTQWLDLSSLSASSLIGKNILIVDEVDDTRTTLEYAVRELEKDVNEARRRLGREDERPTRFSIFVLHNKDKVKKGTLPREMIDDCRYLAARTVGDVWICYPWEATDIEEHDRLAATQPSS
ncbi:MAG: hypothetical protein M1825_002134 [Sarcosagium campestre]|nr:MAG: hypothetical protein M1825_002134 [Sarcosagium campestre]